MFGFCQTADVGEEALRNCKFSAGRYACRVVVPRIANKVPIFKSLFTGFRGTTTLYSFDALRMSFKRRVMLSLLSSTSASVI